MVKKFASFVTAAALLVTMICIPASAELTVISEESYSDMNQTFTPLDLKEAANMGFADEVAGDGIGGWTDQGAINDMSGFDLRGRVNLRGVDFDIIDPEKNNGKSVITLSGQNAEAISNTAEIPVNQRARPGFISCTRQRMLQTISQSIHLYMRTEAGTRFQSGTILKFLIFGEQEALMYARPHGTAAMRQVPAYRFTFTQWKIRIPKKP